MNKIACIIHSLGIGGMERVMSILLNDFACRSNVEVHLILIGKNRNVEFDIDKRIKLYKPNFKFSSAKRVLHTFQTLLFIRRTTNKIQPASILSFGEMWNNLVLISLYKSKYPIYISDRSQPGKNLGRLHNFLRNWLYPKAAGFIAQTSIAGDLAKRKKWNENITVIGNPVRDLHLPRIKKERIVITVGRLIPTKNIDQLIRIFGQIDKTGWRLLIIGGNAKNMNLLAEYQKQIVALNMEGKILLLGEQKDIKTHLAKSSIFAFTSSSEGFPNALAEAISSRLPVVAYSCIAGPSDLIINGKNGYLIEERNEKLFMQCLEELMDSEALRIKFSSSSDAILKNFDVKMIADKFYNVLINK